MKEDVRILIIKMSSLGDIIHALPTLYALRQQYPKAHIAWAVHEQFKDVIPPKPWVDEIIIIDNEGNKPYPTLIIINLRRPPSMDKTDKIILKAIINGNKTGTIKIINLRSHIGIKIFIKN